MDFDVHEAAYRFPAALAEAVDSRGGDRGLDRSGQVGGGASSCRAIDVPRFPLNGGGPGRSWG